jgi:GDP-L-fucose synthase
MEKNEKIFVAGHNGMVGSAIVKKLKQRGFNNLLLKQHSQLDLTQTSKVYDFFIKTKPDYVFLAAAKVGGIFANNNFRGQFIYENLMIAINVIEAARHSAVKKLLFLGSSCIYPRNCPQPIKEEYLLTGPLEKTNEPYAIAKIAGLKLCESYRQQYNCNFISLMPTNLFGEYDNYNLDYSHVIPALIKKFHQAKIYSNPTVEIWGSGKVKREFLYVEDLADACLHLMQHYNEAAPINVGVGKDITIKELAYLIKEIVNYQGNLQFNKNKHEGTPRKILDISNITNLGWQTKYNLTEGLKKTYVFFQKENPTLS